MSQESKPGKRVERNEKVPSLTVAETISYLQEHGVKPLQEWKPDQPFLYVFEEQGRGDDGPFNMIAPEKRPSLARVNGPTNIEFDSPFGGGDTNPGRIAYHMTNFGGPIDYYAIDGETREPVYVRTTARDSRTGNFRYVVLKEHMYEPHEALFPRQDAQKEDLPNT